MAYVDRVFINNVNEILEYGSVDEGNVRAHWPDGKPAHTKRIFNICNKYDLQQEFPLMTLRAHDLQKAVDEMCWIYQRKSSNIRDLHSHVWDQWADVVCLWIRWTAPYICWWLIPTPGILLSICGIRRIMLRCI